MITTRWVMLLVWEIWACANVFGQSGQQNLTPSDRLVFDDAVYDFGVVDEAKGMVSHRFEFVNRGDVPLVISRVNSSCGCATADFTRKPVRSGEKGYVEVTFDPAYRSGFFNKRVAVLTENGKCYSHVWIKGVVKPCVHPIEERYAYCYGADLWMNFKVMPFGTIALNEAKSMILKLANNSKLPMCLTFEMDVENPDISFDNPGRLAPGEEYEMMVVCRNSGRYGAVTKLYPLVNGNRLEQPLTITYRKQEADDRLVD